MVPSAVGIALRRYQHPGQRGKGKQGFAGYASWMRWQQLTKGTRTIAGNAQRATASGTQLSRYRLSEPTFITVPPFAA